MQSPLKGKILVATTSLLDPNFARTLILIVQHDENGAMGLVLNRPLETTVGQAWEQVSAVPYPNDEALFQGGPCEGPLLVVHAEEQGSQLEIASGLYLSSDADAVKTLVSEEVTPLKFFVGYSGWSAMQLEAELAEGAWAIADISAADILHTPEDLWERITRSLAHAHSVRPAVDPRFIPTDPSMN